MSDSTHTATDIITYIGVPLAVLGVLPILYNTAVTLAALSKIKRMLKHSRLTALTRSDVVNRIIEVELPRYAVTPWDRFSNRSEYWTLSRHPSNIPGGSWTRFNWRTNVIGLNTQRVEYADQLRQPQVEVAFDELIAYLLDLGAIPDAHGWRLLRSTGLWTPVGCSLMSSPDGRDKALTIAPLDSSDGHLSLAVSWDAQWTTRDYSYLPPYWVRLPPPPVDERNQDAPGESSSATEIESTEVAQGKSSSIQRKSLDSAQQAGEANAREPITCQISVDGISTALRQEDQLQSSLQLDSLYIDHLRVRHGKSDGVWFASATTAYGTTNQTILWSYKIPETIISFTSKETVPCGVLVLLRMVDESATPEWTTKHDDHGASLDNFTRRVKEQRDAMAAEARLPPAQKAQAAMERQRRENEHRMQDSTSTTSLSVNPANPELSTKVRDKLRLETQRKEARTMDALQSPKWSTEVVARHSLAWLKSTETAVSEAMTVKDVVGTALHRMILDGQFASSLCRMLDLWKAWADNGGMRKSDLTALQEDQTIFAYAALLVAMIKDTSSGAEGTLSIDLQECLRMWRQVRLG